MRTFCHARAALAMVCGAWASGCGTSAPPDYRPPYATIRGTLRIPAIEVDPQEIRVALVWHTSLGLDQAGRLRTQDGPITQTWPDKFSVDIVDLPPLTAIRANADGDPQATGSIVAYRDRNHNEALDFTPVDATDFVDELLAVHGDQSLIYLPEPPASLMFYSAEQAWQDLSTPLTLVGVESAQASCHLLDWLPRSMLTLVRTEARTMDPWPVEPAGECPDVAPPPETREVTCFRAAGETAYVATWSTEPSSFVQTLCGPVVRACTRTLAVDQARPADWPCPCDPSAGTPFSCTNDTTAHAVAASP